MSNLTVQEVNGVEFYVSNDGKEAGVSQNGLSRLSGVARGSIFPILDALVYGAEKTLPKSLDDLRGMVSASPTDGVRLVPAAVAARIIEYYAFDSKAKNETALFSFRKFAALGMEAWVKQVCGYTEVKQDSVSNSDILLALQKLMDKVETLEAKVEDYTNIRKVTVSVFPGLDGMLDSMATGKALPAAKDYVTLNEWLEVKGVTLARSDKHKFANLVAESYRTLTQEAPRKVSRKNSSGKWVQNSAAYLPEHFSILEQAYKQMFG